MSRVLFVINPHANTGGLGETYPSLLKLAKDILGFEPDHVLTRGHNHGIKLAREAVEDNYDLVVSCGGDGTANEVANGLANSDVAFGLFPAGSMNDHHKTHGIPDNWEIAMKILKAGYTVHTPLGLAIGDTKRYFLDMIDAGLSGYAAQAAHYEAKWLKGELKYDYLTAKYLLRLPKIQTEMRVNHKKVYRFEMNNIGITLGHSIVGYRVWPGNHPFVGDFGLFVAYKHNKYTFVKTLLAADQGKHVGMPGVFLSRGKYVEITTDRGIPWEADGEIFSTNATHLTVEYIPNAIWVVVPKRFYAPKIQKYNIQVRTKPVTPQIPSS